MNTPRIFFVSLFLSLMCQGAMAQYYYPNFYEAPKESYVKSMKTVFSDLHSRKWEKAQRDYAKLEEKSALALQRSIDIDYANTQMDALYPLPQLAMSILLSTENTMVPTITVDYGQAYTLLKYAINYKAQAELTAFLSDPDVNVNLSVLEDKIENELCRQATAENTEKAYDAVIDTLLPKSLYVQTMKTQREDLVYNTIVKSPTESECSRFLTKYTDALQAHRRRISQTLDSLRYSAVDGSIESLSNYIKQYPSSSYLDKAKTALENKEYQSIDNTAASCRRFLDKYPLSKYTMEVKKRYTDLAYKETLASGTAAAYQQYCKDFPYDLHYQDLFDSLLTRTVRDIYNTVLAGQQPDEQKILSAAFYDVIQKRVAAEQDLIAHSLVPPRRRDMWTGTAQGIEAKLFDHFEIKSIDLKSKTMASVDILLTGPSIDTDTDAAVQSEIFLDFVIEDSSLKLDDIRLDNGSSSQKSGAM